jgi:hypothetical protein
MPTYREDPTDYARRRRKEWYKEFRPTTPCVNCGATTNLQWDHIDPSTKLFDVMTGCTRLYRRARIMAEIAKCQVLCGTCNTVRRSKHPQALIDAIRAATGSQSSIAKEFGVSPSYVSRIKNDKRRTVRVTV